MAKKKLTKSEKVKKQKRREARQRKKHNAQKKIEAFNKEVQEFCELVISEMLNDKCLFISRQKDGGLNISEDFIDLMYPYVNRLEGSSSIKRDAIDMIAERLEKIFHDMMMDYLPDVKEIASIAVKRFNSGERSKELRVFVRDHCDGYYEWEDLFWDITEKQGFNVEDYDALPGYSMIEDVIEIRKKMHEDYR